VNLKLATLALALVTAVGAQAQTAASSPAKKELVQKVLQLQQGGVDSIARLIVEQPAGQLMQQAGMALQQGVPADKREATAREIQADIKKYVDEAYPIVRASAAKLAPTVLGPMLEERFSEDELKQLVAWLESPVSRKYQQTAPELQKALGEKLVAETRATIEPKLKALDQTVVKRLGLQPAAPAASAAAPKKK
jgi:hypothetical protein